MSENQTDLRRSCPQTPAAKLRRIGLIVLVAGLAIGGLLYLLAPKPNSPEDDPALAGYYDKQDLARQQMYGKSTAFVLNALESLKHLRTYSGIVIAGSVVVSFICFYLARDAYDGGNSGQGKATS
jgi:hypothetical protein